MASNPDWENPNKNVSDSTIHKRVFDYDNDAYRVNVIEPIELEVSDIEIGKVEIKDSDSDTTLNVVDVGGSNAILSRDVIDQIKTSVNIFSSALVSPSALVTLASYTVSANTIFTFTGGIVGGDEAGEFHFEVDGNDIALVRNSGSQRTITLHFPESQQVGAGSLINIKVKNIGNKSKQFESTLSGFIIPN